MTEKQFREMLDDLGSTERENLERGFEIFIDHYSPKICGLLLSIGIPDGDVQDVFQDLCLKFLEIRWDCLNFQHEGAFAKWVFTIAMNLAKDYFRRNKRDAVLVQELAQAPFLEGTSDNFIPRTQNKERVWKVIESLPEKDRKILELRYRENLSVPAISQDLGLKISTVKTQLRRAIQKVKRHIGTIE